MHDDNAYDNEDLINEDGDFIPDDWDESEDSFEENGNVYHCFNGDDCIKCDFHKYDEDGMMVCTSCRTCGCETNYTIWKKD